MIRASGQLLHRPSGARDPVEAVRDAAFIQAQDPQAARLGVRARVRGITAKDVDDARSDRALMRGWAMRGTLHLFPAEDTAWLLSLFQERELRSARSRIHKLMGLDRRAQDRALGVVRRLLESRGEPVLRTDVVAELERAGFDTSTNAIHHLGRLAVLEGAAFLGPDAGIRTTYVSARAWLDPGKTPRREAAMEELARRHVGAFAPADERDLAAWSGLGLRECRAALERIGAELTEVKLEGERKWALQRRPLRAPRRPLVRMLGAFDNHLMGHGNRDVSVPREHLKRVWPGSGIVNATLLVDGIAAATWKTRRSPGRIEVVLEPFAPLDAATLTRIESEVAEIGRFEGREATLEVRPASNRG